MSPPSSMGSTVGIDSGKDRVSLGCQTRSNLVSEPMWRAVDGINSHTSDATVPRPRAAILLANNKPETGPCLVDGAHLVVDHSRGEKEIAHGVSGEIGLDAGALLGPGNPDGTVGGDECHGRGIAGLHFGGPSSKNNEDV